MDVKTFEATTMRDAVKMVKSQFGSDAVIMKSKERIHPQGGRIFEVTAARSPNLDAKNSRDDSYPGELIEVVRSIYKLESNIKKIEDTMITKEQILGIDGRIDDLRHLMLEILSKSDSGYLAGKNASVASILHYLKVMNIDDQVLAKLANYLDSLPEPEAPLDIPEDYYKAFAIRWLLKRVQIASIIDNSDEDSKVRLFVGSSGSGKTSLLAKTAYYLEKKTDVTPVVLSLEGKKISANESLRIYCKVLNIRHHSVESGQDIAKIYNDHSEGHLILVDTEGVNPKGDASIARFKEIRNQPFSVEVNLLLSLTDKSDHLENIVKNFSSVGIDAVSFTRLDCSWSYGDVINISQKWGLPVASFSTGPNIPEDIERATRERIVERIFGLGKE